MSHNSNSKHQEKARKRREGQRPQGRIGAKKARQRAYLDFVLTVNKQTMKQIHERAPGKKRKKKRKRETTTTRARVGYCFAASHGGHGLLLFFLSASALASNNHTVGGAGAEVGGH